VEAGAQFVLPRQHAANRKHTRRYFVAQGLRDRSMKRLTRLGRGGGLLGHGLMHS